MNYANLYLHTFSHYYTSIGLYSTMVSYHCCPVCSYAPSMVYRTGTTEACWFSLHKLISRTGLKYFITPPKATTTGFSIVTSDEKQGLNWRIKLLKPSFLLHIFSILRKSWSIVILHFHFCGGLVCVSNITSKFSIRATFVFVHVQTALYKLYVSVCVLYLYAIFRLHFIRFRG